MNGPLLIPYRSMLARAVLLLALMPVLPVQEAAGQVRPATLEELTRESSAVLLGTCTKKESQWNDQRSRILTKVTIRVDEQVTGEVGSEAVVTVPGGRVGNTLYEVSDMPAFDEGEQVLVFLWRHPSGPLLVTGASQGKLTVVEEEADGRRVVLGADRLLRQGADKAAGSVSGRGPVPLEAVVQAVRQAGAN